MVYFMHVGAKSTLTEFMWSVQGKFSTNMDDIKCMSQCFLEGHLYYVVEFPNMESVGLFLLEIGEGILRTDTGAIFVHVDIEKGTVIVTITDVHSSITFMLWSHMEMPL
jgi:hypothetical protein